MTSKKIIVRGCPAFVCRPEGRTPVCSNTWDGLGGITNYQDVTDCKIKQIIGLCRDINPITNVDYITREPLNKILQLLDVQEGDGCQ